MVWSEAISVYTSKWVSFNYTLAAFIDVLFLHAVLNFEKMLFCSSISHRQCMSFVSNFMRTALLLHRGIFFSDFRPRIILWASWDWLLQNHTHYACTLEALKNPFFLRSMSVRSCGELLKKYHEFRWMNSLLIKEKVFLDLKNVSIKIPPNAVNSQCHSRLPGPMIFAQK